MSPILLQIGPVQIHWYGVMYALTFLISYFYLMRSKRLNENHFSPADREQLFFGAILGVILGGRIGYILFYNLSFYLQNPAQILAIWQGGLSFHGGVLGVLIALALYSKRKQKNFLMLGDTVVKMVPVGIFFGRIGNFINGELYGRIAENYCMYFHTDPTNCRYPSQLLESFLEGAVLFIILWLYDSKKTSKVPGKLSALFLICYGILRTIAEFFREPDPQIGFLFNRITTGQLLSSFMIIAGIIIYGIINEQIKKKKYERPEKVSQNQ